tara:strand:- start:2125 stop:3681 length:1557 start_codon:yes stop_codon:yes gene_type:complete
MRFFEFKVFENIKDQDIDNNLDTIVTVAANAKEKDPGLYKKIQNQLQRLKQKADQLLAKQGKDPAVEEDVALAQNDPIMVIIVNMRNTIASLCDNKPIEVCNNPEAMSLAKDLDSMEKQLPDQYKKERGEERKQTIKDMATFKKEMKGKLTQLVKKAEGLKPETPLDKNAMNSVQQSILNQLSSIIDSIEDKDFSPETVNKFLDYAIAGEIIDMKGLVAAKQGKIDDHINPKLDPEVKELFDDEIKKAFFSFIPGGTTAGNYGPAEVGLAILGNPAKKAESRGDLIVGDVAFELKGSGYKLNAKGEIPKGEGSLYGARLNSKGIGPGTAGWETLNREIKKINPKMKETNPRDEKGAMNDEGYMNAFNVQQVKGKTVKKLSSRFNFNGSGLKTLNNEVLIPNGNPKDTIELLSNTFKAIVNGWKKVNNWDERIAAMVDSDGSINQQKMLKNYSAIAYDSYNKEDEVENILFVNSVNRNYYLIGNQDELMKAIDNGDIKIKGGITWNDDQQKATPQYGRA